MGPDFPCVHGANDSQRPLPRFHACDFVEQVSSKNPLVDRRVLTSAFAMGETTTTTAQA